ncbi:MAG: hypothetical protein H6865_04490 [Rhodospirillales bacterium]|nr:hypothetical protein [Alphaproteobacteria bacterium]MCB9986877.1 hypothetical protein [Rhodospirillales bacterium]USO08345.1 MAG: hypothetical protein H6866_03800 [Rhodospirillales bacterium]
MAQLTDQFLKQAFPDIGMGDVLPENGAEQTILVDINGTLIDANHRRGLNLELFEFLTEAEKRGYRVLLHSSKPEENMSLVLPLVMMRNTQFKAFVETRDPEFEPILHKQDTNSAAAFMTIDDEHGGGYLSSAPRQWGANDRRMYATMAAWGVPFAYDPPPAPRPVM